METPATLKGQRAQSLILVTAARLMHKNGIAATSMDDVLSASGTGKSQMYHYFHSKEHLVVAVLDYQFQRAMANQPSLYDEECSDLAQWRSEILAANEKARFSGCPLGVFAGQLGGSALLHAKCAELFASWQAALAALIARAVGAGRLSPQTRPDDAALVLLGAVEGGAMLSQLNRHQDDLERMLDAALGCISAS
jgi:AcrR family transcriptional regulator